MKPLVTSSQAAALDRRLRDEIGVPEAALMENAASGMESALAYRGFFGRPQEDSGRRAITALAGRGNNGGDAVAVLRRRAFASAGSDTPELTVLLSSGEPTGLAASQLQAARGMGIKVLSWEGEEAECRAVLRRSALVLDGIAGSGLSGPLRSREAALAETAASCGAAVAAVDVPSGFGDGLPGGSPSIRAALTLCVEPLKTCLFRPAARPSAGKIICVSGVFPRDSGSDSPGRLLESGDLPALVTSLPPEVHKYERGHCLVFAGDVGTSGAANLAARGAAAGGSGLVSLYVRPALWTVAAASLAGEIVKTLPEDPASIDLRRANAVVAGPGWGRDSASAAVLGRLWDSGLPLVLDADALPLLRSLDPPARTAPLILTPHPGEASGISGRPISDFLDDPEKALGELARRWGAVVVLKSCVTWIMSPGGRFAVYDGMDGFLAVGGSGDVLAGLCGALLARGTPAFEAAQAAVLSHGLAGGCARSELGLYGAEALPGYAAKILGGLHAG